jgi:hypothetical protein
MEDLWFARRPHTEPVLVLISSVSTNEIGQPKSSPWADDKSACHPLPLIHPLVQAVAKDPPTKPEDGRTRLQEPSSISKEEEEQKKELTTSKKLPELARHSHSYPPSYA